MEGADADDSEPDPLKENAFAEHVHLLKDLCMFLQVFIEGKTVGLRSSMRQMVFFIKGVAPIGAEASALPVLHLYLTDVTKLWSSAFSMKDLRQQTTWKSST